MKKKLKKEVLLLPKLLRNIAPTIGAKVVLEPTWGIVGQITFRGGKKSYFRYNTLDLNPVGASDVAKDKDYAAFFMRKMGYPALRGRTFFRDDFADAIASKQDTHAALRYAQHRYPLVAKPNSGSQGVGVALVSNERELKRALKEIFKNDRVALLQRPVKGRDYRIVVLDDQVISSYERVPLNVVGDGRSTISKLLQNKQHAFIASSRDTRIKLDDPRIKAKLRAQQLTLRSVPNKDAQIFLLDNANLSSGGDAIDVPSIVHPSFKRLAIQLTKDMGLRLCGVDMMIEGTIAAAPQKYWILEINAAPGLDHYVKTGKEQKKIVEEMYLKVLKSLQK